MKKRTCLSKKMRFAAVALSILACVLSLSALFPVCETSVTVVCAIEKETSFQLVRQVTSLQASAVATSPGLDITEQKVIENKNARFLCIRGTFDGSQAIASIRFTDRQPNTGYALEHIGEFAYPETDAFANRNFDMTQGMLLCTDCQSVFITGSSSERTVLPLSLVLYTTIFELLFLASIFLLSRNRSSTPTDEAMLTIYNDLPEDARNEGKKRYQAVYKTQLGLSFLLRLSALFLAMALVSGRKVIIGYAIVLFLLMCWGTVLSYMSLRLLAAVRRAEPPADIPTLTAQALPEYQWRFRTPPLPVQFWPPFSQLLDLSVYLRRDGKPEQALEIAELARTQYGWKNAVQAVCYWGLRTLLLRETQAEADALADAEHQLETALTKLAAQKRRSRAAEQLLQNGTKILAAEEIGSYKS